MLLCITKRGHSLILRAPVSEIHIVKALLKPRRPFHSTSSTNDQNANEHQHPPISDDEFENALNCSRPLKVWPSKIAVAFSGGADSTCLLYLLNRFVSKSDTALGTKPTEVVALTVDHALQPMSETFTQRCKELADHIRVKHVTMKIPWGEPPYPPNPVSPDSVKQSAKGTKSGQRPFEAIARSARYHVLFDSLQSLGISVLAMGHHADDQVETALLRLAMGSSEVGAGGMRSCRRWGMGLGRALGPGVLGWAGLAGMDMWITRPLLQFPKDRILSTCRANGLEYVDDPTNFQPDVTIRNSIRYKLDNMERSSLFDDSGASTISEAEALVNLAAVSSSLDSDEPTIRASTMEETHKEYLRLAVRSLYQHRNQVESKVSEFFNRALVPTPVSTLAISVPEFQTIIDPAVRIGMILRALRYVSPFPWGSPRAEAGRRTSNLKLAMETFGRTSSFSPRAPRTAFVAGGGVLCLPITIGAKGALKLREPKRQGTRERAAWLLTRQTPRRTRNGTESKAGVETQLVDTLPDVDITRVLQTSIWRMKGPNKSDVGTHSNREDISLEDPLAVEVLYDCRFLVRLKPRTFPQPVLRSILLSGSEWQPWNTSIIITHHSQYVLPRVVMRLHDPTSTSVQDFELARFLPTGTVAYGVIPSRIGLEPSVEGDVINQQQKTLGIESPSPTEKKRDSKTTMPSGSIEIRWARSLDADGSYPERGESIRVLAPRPTRGWEG